MIINLFIIDKQLKDTVLMVMLNQFPGHCNRIKRLYRANESFREICDDYVLCQESIKKIQATEKARETYLDELLEIRQELEDEIMFKVRVLE